MKKFIKIICAALIAAVILSTGSVLAAGNVTVVSECDISDIDVPIETAATPLDIGTVLDIKAKSAILMEVSTGQILYESNADEALPPASITKVMSLLLIMEAIEQKRFSLEDVITASEHAAGMGGSQIWLKENESMTVDDLLKAAVIASANDATVALAEKVAGSEEGFVLNMNEKAKELGLNSTCFKNATGLDEEGHLSSAHDIAVMSKELIKHPLIKNYTTVWMESLRDGKTELVNTNKLVRFYEGTTGLKTGTTSSAGYCLAATCERQGLSLVAVVMAADSSAERFSAAKKLLDFGFANYTVKNVTADKKALKKAKVAGGMKSYITPSETGSIPILMKKSDTSECEIKVTYNKNIKAPVKKGAKIGIIEILNDNTVLYTGDIYADESVNKKTVLNMFVIFLKRLFYA